MHRLLKSGILCLYRALALLPAVLLMGGLIPDCTQLSAALLYAVGQLAACGASFVPAQHRVKVIVLLLLAYIAAGIFLFTSVPLYYVILGYCVAAYLINALGLAQNRFDLQITCAGIAVYAISPVIIRLNDIAMNYTAMDICGILFFIILPYLLNDTSVREGMSLRGRGGKPIKRIAIANRGMVTVLLVIAVIVATFDRLKDAASRAFQTIAYWIWVIVEFLTNLGHGDETGGGGGGDGGFGDLGLGEASEPSWFAKFMEKVFMYLVWVVLAAAAIFLLYKLYKLLVKLVGKIREWAKRYAAGVSEDYVEEHEQLLDWGDVTKEMRQAVLDRLHKLTNREKKWNDLDARERVRFILRYMYRRQGAGISGIEYLSARQALGEMRIPDSVKSEIGELYDRARYSDHEITGEEVESAKKQMNA